MKGLQILLHLPARAILAGDCCSDCRAVPRGALDAAARARPRRAAAPDGAGPDGRRRGAAVRLHGHRRRRGDGAAGRRALPRRLLLRRAGALVAEGHQG